MFKKCFTCTSDKSSNFTNVIPCSNRQNLRRRMSKYILECSPNGSVIHSRLSLARNYYFFLCKCVLCTNSKVLFMQIKISWELLTTPSQHECDVCYSCGARLSDKMSRERVSAWSAPNRLSRCRSGDLNGAIYCETWKFSLRS